MSSRIFMRRSSSSPRGRIRWMVSSRAVMRFFNLVISSSVFMVVVLIFLANVEVWHRLPGAPLRNRIKGCS